MKTIYKKLLFLLLFLPFCVLAQNTIGGTVLDKVTGQPIPGVNVNVQGSTTGASTDLDGKFRLSNVKKGDKVVCTLTGHGLKDPDLAVKQSAKPHSCKAVMTDIAKVLNL